MVKMNDERVEFHHPYKEGEEPEKIVFDLDLLERLKRAYATALDEGVEAFKFEGHVWFVPYAKYVIEYLSLEFDQ